MTDKQRWKAYVRRGRLIRKVFAGYLASYRLTEEELSDMAQIVADFKSSADFGKRQLREVSKNA